MKRFRKAVYLVMAAFFGVASGSLLQAQKLTIHLDPADTQIRYTVTDTIHTVHGTFKLKGALIVLDAKTGVAEGELVVDANSDDSGSNQRDKVVKKNVLEVDRYPLISFHPLKVTGEPRPGSLQDITVDGSFNIHGNDHPLRMGVKVQTDGDKIVATTHFIVPYVDWGLKDASNFFVKVGKEVSVDVVAHGVIEGMHN